MLLLLAVFIFGLSGCEDPTQPLSTDISTPVSEGEGITDNDANSIYNANSCSAEGLLGSCTANCPQGQTPVCETKMLGFKVKCSCEGEASPAESEIGQDAGQSQNMIELQRTLNSMSTPESSNSLQLLNIVQDRIDVNDIAGYEEATDTFVNSLQNLNANEKAVINQWLASKGITETL